MESSGVADRQNPDVNAYTDPRKTALGCQHRLGCKCETPFWLREPTPREVKFEEIYIRTGFVIDEPAI